MAGKTRVRVPSGVYKPCRGPDGCRGRGYVRGQGGVKLPHARCSGDGWIKVGSQRSGRGGKVAARLRKARNRALLGGGAYVAAGQLVGPLAASLVLVVIVLVLVLAAHRALSSVRSQ